MSQVAAEDVLVRRFPCMGTEVRLYVRPEGGCRRLAEVALREWEQWFHQAHHTLSRFDPRSELCRLNRAPERWHVVSPLLGEVLAAALRAAHSTDGLFDPTLLGALVALGYDRPFAFLRRTGGGSSVPRGGGWRSVRALRLSDGRYLVERPVGVQLEFGGIAKGWAADQAVKSLSELGPAAVDVGGDVRVAVPEGSGLTWPVEVEDPWQPGRVWIRFGLTDGGVCTSSVLGRRWRLNRRWVHHVLDPATGKPAAAGAVAATVVAATAADAEALAKACLVLGPARALPWVEARGAMCLVVGEDGRVAATRQLEEVCRRDVD